MSTIFNLLCPICAEVFHNGDEIHSTNCGHVIHYRCFVQWRERSSSCPQCRSPDPTTHKLYLSFDESAEAAANFEELKSQLIKSKDENNLLKAKVDEKNDEIHSLKEIQKELASQHAERCEEQQKEIESLQNSIEELNLSLMEEKETVSKELENLKSSSDTIINELRKYMKLVECNMEEKETLSKELENLKSSSDTIINELRKELTELADANENHTECTASETVHTSLEEELRKLKDDLKNTSSLLTDEVSKNSKLTIECMNLKSRNSLQNPIFEENNRILEQKLKHITAELEKQISKSTQLEIDNMKLQNYVDCIKSNVATPNNHKSHKPRSMNNMQKAAASNVFSSSESINLKNEKTYNFFDSSSNSIVIQKFPSINLLYPLEKNITLIAINISVHLSQSEIDKVNIVKGKHHKLSELVSLFVRFKTKSLKNQFLENKNRLMFSDTPFLRSVQIREYIDNGAQHLFIYANEKLRGKGYEHIFWTNNQIFAKKHPSDPRGIRILNKEQVDELIEKESNWRAPNLDI